MKFKVASKAFKEKMKILSDFSFNDGTGNYIRIKSIDNGVISINRENNINACEVEIFADVIEEGNIALPFSELFTVVSSDNDAKELVFSTDDKSLHIFSEEEKQNFEYQVKLVPLDSDPIEWNTNQSFRFSPVLFTGMLKTASVFASTDESRAYLCGVRVENVDGSLRMSSTDGKRACRSMLEKNGDGSTDVAPFKSFTMPIKFAKIVAKNMGKLKEDLIISVGENHVTITGQKIKMHSVLVREGFPVIDRFMSAKKSFEVTMNATDLYKALTRASACKDKSNGVFIELDTNTATISSSNETRSVTDTIDAHYTGKKTTMSFAFEYLTDLLNVFSNDMISIHLDTPEKPILTDDDKATYVIMPRARS